MVAIDAPALLRPGLLTDVRLLLAGTAARGDSLAEAVEAACRSLGASVSRCTLIADAGEDEAQAASEAAVAGALAEIGGIDVLVVDADALFADGPPTRRPKDALLACLDVTWTLTRSVFNLAMLPALQGGRIVYLAPVPGAEHAEPALAGLENLSRTLSIEWARHGVTAVTIAPGRETAAGEVAALCAYLASPAGSYFSGCLLDLGGPDR